MHYTFSLTPMEYSVVLKLMEHCCFNGNGSNCCINGYETQCGNTDGTEWSYSIITMGHANGITFVLHYYYKAQCCNTTY